MPAGSRTVSAENICQTSFFVLFTHNADHPWHCLLYHHTSSSFSTCADSLKLGSTMPSLRTAVLIVAFLSLRVESLMMPNTLRVGHAQAQRSKSSVAKPAALFFLDGIRDLGFTAKRPASITPKTDTTEIGNLKVPTVGIGTISWSSTNPLGLENAELQSLTNTAVENNAALFDTAERYGSHYKTAIGFGWGETERLTRKLLGNAPGPGLENRLSPVVATKFTPSPWRTSVDSVVEACRQSCERLGVEQIDLYQLHMPDIVQPLRFLGQDKSKDEVYWHGLAECHRLGLAKNVGVCNYGPSLLKRCTDVLDKYNVPLASNQIAYSLIGRHNGAQETVDYCNENGIKVLAFFPFAMGLLTGKYSVDPNADIPLELSLTKSQKTALEERELRQYLPGMAPLLSVMNDIAKSRQKTLAQIALNYIVCQGAIPIPGSRTRAQVADNIGAMGWRLTPTEIARLEDAADQLGTGFEGAGFKRTSEKFVGYGVEKWTLD